MCVPKIDKTQKQPLEVFCKKKVFWENSQNSQENPQACNVIKKETLVQVFSCDFCKHIRMNAS